MLSETRINGGKEVMTTDMGKRAAKGGKARAKALSPKRRAEIARMGARARMHLDESEKAALPNATHRGPLKIADDLVLPCAVLSDGTRVITETAVARQLGRGLGGKTQRLAARSTGNGPPLPAYLTATLEKYVPDSLRIALNHPITYRDRGGVRRAVNAALLPDICEVWLKARDAKALQPSQEPIARRAEALTRALSRVGVIALVDEATGYQEVRDRYELHRILEAYIAKELLPWAKRFPDEFYQELFRLRGWEYSPPSPKRPKLVGKLTNEIVYEKLPKGVLDELRNLNPVVKDGWRRHKHHQFLTEDIGNPHLEKHIVAVMTLMRVAPSWSAFKRLLSRAFPGEGTQMEMIGIGNEDDL